MSYYVKQRREATGMTQAELAEKAGVSRTIVSMLENDKSTVTSTGTLEKLAKALGCTVSEIFN